MKYRFIKTNMRIPATDNFYWVIEYKKHWFSRWKMVKSFEGDYRCDCPLFFSSKEDAINYLKN